MDKHWQYNGLTEELSDFQHGNVIGCPLSNKSVCKVSAQLELPRSTISAVNVKWKSLGTTTTQTQSGRPRKLTGPPSAESIAHKNSLSSVTTLTTDFQTVS